MLTSEKAKNIMKELGLIVPDSEITKIAFFSKKSMVYLETEDKEKCEDQQWRKTI